jgi:hypothetical protein
MTLNQGGSLTQPCSGDDYKASLGKVSGGFKASEAKRFLELLGKDNAATWLRAIDPVKTRRRSGGADYQGVASKADKAWIDAKTAAGFNVYAITGNADAIKGTSVKDTDITRCPALFVEWDDGADIDTQAQRWQELELPEPTLMVSTGGKSVHCYWVLLEPMAPEPWRVLQSRLITYCKGDAACKNPSRLMRLPGSVYFSKRNRGANRPMPNHCRRKHRYAAFDIEGCLPAPAPAKPVKAAPSRQFEPRSEAELIDALRQVPVFAHGEGRREELLGLAFRLAAELGADRGLQLMQEHSPDVDDLADYFKAEPDHISAGSIWPFMREHYGIDISRSRTSKTVKTVKATTAEPGTGNAIRLKPNQILKLLPEKVGDLRLNIRSGDVHTATGILNANDAGHLYLKLSTSSETWGKDVTADAVAYLANQNQFDPVADFLNDTGNELPMEQWQRLDQHLLGINDPIAAEFLPRYLIGAVARVFKPGCDVRQTPVLVGPQWRGKTALGRILFGAEHWISGVGDLGKDALMRLHTGWGIELAELDGVTRRSDQESLKAFLTETCDSIRRPYDVATVRHLRKFVFWGTSNGAALRDTTGNTRYVTIPIPDRMLPLEWAQRHRNALWARAVEQYKAGVDWNQCSDAIRNAIADRNANFT